MHLCIKDTKPFSSNQIEIERSVDENIVHTKHEWDIWIGTVPDAITS